MTGKTTMSEGSVIFIQCLAEEAADNNLPSPVSIDLVAEALGWEPDELIERLAAILARRTEP